MKIVPHYEKPSLRPHTLSRVECCLRPTDLLHAVGLTRSPCDLWLLPMRRVGYAPRGGKSLLPVGLMRLVRKSASIGGGFFPSPLDTYIIPQNEREVNSQIAQIFASFSASFYASCTMRAGQPRPTKNTPQSRGVCLISPATISTATRKACAL